MALYVNEVGPEDAPTILFLHGGGVGGWSWRPQVAALQAEYHLLVPDLPEHGQSMDAGTFTIPDAAQRAARLIQERAHGGRAHVVGLSLGAQVALKLLADAQGLLDHVMISGTLVRRLPGASLAQATYQVYKPFRNIPGLIRANMRNAGIPETYFKEMQEETRRLSGTTLAHVTRANLGFGLPSGLGSITLPVLVTVGERERGVMKASARDILAAISTAEGYLVRGANHTWNLERPDLFNHTLRAWITGHRLPEDLQTLQ